MKKLISLTLCLCLALGCLAIPATDTPETALATVLSAELNPVTEKPQSENKNYKEGEVLVTLAMPKGADSDLMHAGSFAGDRSIQVKRIMKFGGASVLGKNKREKKSLKGSKMVVCSLKSTAYTSKQLINFLKKYNYVYSVSKNYLIHTCAAESDSGTFSKPNDPLFDEQWYLGGEHFYPNGSAFPVTGSAASGAAATNGELSATPVEGCSTVPAATIGFTPEKKQELGDKAPIVAVIDSGIDHTHEDLKNCMWINPYSKKKLPGKYGYDFIDDDDDPTPDPLANEASHATAIAGIIAGENDNGIGITGISANAKLMSLRIFGAEGSTWEAELAAYEYIYKAAKLGANIVAVNCSYGTEPFEEDVITEVITPIEAAIKKNGKMGIVTVFSAGNESADTDIKKWGEPEQLNNKYTLKVGASTYEGTICSYSNYGKTGVDLFAPGDTILTSTLYHEFLPEIFSDEERAAKCSYFEVFSSKSAIDSTKTISDFFPDKKSEISLSHGERDFHGNNASGTLKIDFALSRNKDPRAYRVYFDITDIDLDPKKDCKIHFTLVNSTENPGEWNDISGSLNRSQALGIFTHGGHTYLSLDFRSLRDDLTEKIGTSFYIDNLTISCPDPDMHEYSKYTYVGGTSFSAPIVAAAIARLAVMYPKDNAQTRVKKIMSSVRKLDAFADKCVSGGTLDMTMFDSPDDIMVK